MKMRVTGLCIVCWLLAAIPLFAQPSPASGIVFVDAIGHESFPIPPTYAIAYTFSRLNNIKTLTLQIYKCDYTDLYNGNAFALALSVPGFPNQTCVPQEEGLPVQYSAIQTLLQQLNNWASGAPEQVNQSGAPVRSPRPSFSTIQPVAPPDPTAIILDGLSGNVLEVDLSTGATVSTVAPPQTALGPLAIRPSPTPPSPEVWVANGGTQVSVLNMTAQTVTANIPTPSIPSSATPVGIVFTNNGNTALEAIRLPSPDASGNLGVLVIFDAVNRAVSSTFPLKYGPSAIIMAPDGLTIYLLSTGGEITYYDVLSGTADLSASTYTPGMNGGYNGVSNAFIHPDGTRLFWAVGPYVESFNLNSRTVTAQFDSGLPTTSAITFGLSQDGTLATMSNGQGAAVILDTQYGAILGTVTFAGPTQIFLGN